MSEEKDVKTLIAEAVAEATEGLKNKNADLLAKLQKAQKGQEIDPKDYEALQNKNETLEAELAKANKLNKETTKQLETVAKQLESEIGFTNKLLLDNGLTDALVKAGIKKELLQAANALFSQQAKVIAEGDTRKAVIGDKELSAFVGEWASSDEGKHFVQAPANGGGGADGSRNTPQGDKVVNRATWDTMSHVERSQFATSGGKVTD